MLLSLLLADASSIASGVAIYHKMLSSPSLARSKTTGTAFMQPKPSVLVTMPARAVIRVVVPSSSLARSKTTGTACISSKSAAADAWLVAMEPLNAFHRCAAAARTAATLS